MGYLVDTVINFNPPLSFESDGDVNILNSVRHNLL